MKNKRTLILLGLITIVIAIFLYLSLDPIREFRRIHNYPEEINYAHKNSNHDNTKKTITIVADHKTTEIFDLIAPYYLFSSTQKANVYIIAEDISPIYLFKGLFVFPHFSFKEFNETNIKTDAIIIPNLSAMEPHEQNPKILEWIKTNYKDANNILSICAGASTAAATGIYDNQPLTTHASDYDAIKKHYPKPQWVTDVSITNSFNLYSTAGVSNAVEGSLMLIKKMFDEKTMLEVEKMINYPHLEPRIEHQSVKINLNNKLTILKKVLFKKNQNIGVLLQDGVDEFSLASILDTYNRTFPKSINSFTLNDMSIKSKYGLTLVPTQRFEEINADEIHITHSLPNLKSTFIEFNETELISYAENNEYMIEQCLDRIEKQHGSEFKVITKLLLDYN